MISLVIILILSPLVIGQCQQPCFQPLPTPPRPPCPLPPPMPLPQPCPAPIPQLPCMPTLPTLPALPQPCPPPLPTLPPSIQQPCCTPASPLPPNPSQPCPPPPLPLFPYSQPQMQQMYRSNPIPYNPRPSYPIPPPLPSYGHYQITPPDFFSRAQPDVKSPIGAKEKSAELTKAESPPLDPFEKETNASRARDEGGTPRLGAYMGGYLTEPRVALPQQPIIYPPPYQPQPQPQQQQIAYPQQQPIYPTYMPSPASPTCVRPTVPLPPMQNCCLQCNRMCSTTVNKKKALGSKTWRWNGPKGKIAKRVNNEELCNDVELGQKLKEISSLGMIEAKEAILKWAEQNDNLVHVFCASGQMEYAARTEKFCADAVADGMCFAFATQK